ncbi:hypothetical protein LJC32_02270 [Oscillospiraceae bacterium OttesenSCG-928-F05]|nr:hypothetical protein [Oscillospiraceae bacterium OttesenSCG-928-F05]
MNTYRGKMKRRQTRPLSAVKATAFLLGLAMLLGFFPGLSLDVSAGGNPAYGGNTAYITSKTAKWTDAQKFEAELTLTVNGTQVRSPLDVVIVLDRSGSMDMTWPGNTIARTFDPFYGYPTASCPCLNQDHFYLEPVARRVGRELDKTVTYQFHQSFSKPYSAQDITVAYYDGTDLNVKMADGSPYKGWAADNIPNHVIGRGILMQPGEKNYGYADLAAITGYCDDSYTQANSYTPSSLLNQRILKNSSTRAVTYYNPDDGYWYEHGYETPEPVAGADKTKVYPLSNGNLAVYKGDSGFWTEVDPSKEIHLYHQFSSSTNKYIPYHFKKDGSDYQLISRWDATDWSLSGIWKHADAGLGCYDRWTEAKSAIAAFSDDLIDAHPDNTVALVPFSMRDGTTLDNTMLKYMNTGNPALRDWIIDKIPKAFHADGRTGLVSNGKGNDLIGTAYNSTVSWTRDEAAIPDMLSRLFTTGNTDYVYGLSMAYNLLTERPDKTKQAVVLFLSDGVPYSMDGSTYIPNMLGNTDVAAFYNPDAHITALADAIKGTADVTTPTSDFWDVISGKYQRHDVKVTHLLPGNSGAPGLGTQLVTVGYMIDGDGSGAMDRLEKIATATESYINIPANAANSTKGRLEEKLLNASLFPGGHESVLRDTISKYYYVPDSWVSPYPNVKILGTQDGPQVIEWTIGDIYTYPAENEPSITVPLVLREQYRTVDQTTYYPTNEYTPAADPDPELYKPENGPDGGAVLDYLDPENNDREHTITTPKLPVPPTSPGNPGNPTPTATPTVTPTATPTPTPDVTPSVTPDVTPTATPPATPAPTPGGTNPGEPPAPTNPGNTLEPTDDGGYIEVDEGGVPLGEWRWDPEPEEWVFDEYPPLSNLPDAGGGSLLLWLPYGLGFGLIGLGSLLKKEPGRRVKR